MLPASNVTAFVPLTYITRDTALPVQFTASLSQPPETARPVLGTEPSERPNPVTRKAASAQDPNIPTGPPPAFELNVLEKDQSVELTAEKFAQNLEGVRDDLERVETELDITR